jgi:hypothetical protein
MSNCYLSVAQIGEMTNFQSIENVFLGWWSGSSSKITCLASMRPWIQKEKKRKCTLFLYDHFHCFCILPEFSSQNARTKVYTSTKLSGNTGQKCSRVDHFSTGKGLREVDQSIYLPIIYLSIYLTSLEGSNLVRINMPDIVAWHDLSWEVSAVPFLGDSFFYSSL